MVRLAATLVCTLAAALMSSGLARAQIAPAVAEASERVEARGPILLELFTSQGCSACPPADRLLASLAARDDLLVLSFHVAYWDHMGWSDPYAIPASARRQRGYARAMRSRSIYTPQLVVQGSSAVVGSDGPRIERLLADAAPTVALAISREMAGTERFVISVPKVADVAIPLELWVVLYTRHGGGFVAGGENAGRTLEHANIVRQAGIVAVVEETPAVVTIDRPSLEADGVALILQGRNLGPVVGTGNLALK
ncbi:DUF1223 domain-containing protein [Elioraea rosea]|uniref:DUF1223 domain-containing protein n=1 Tax=Elioraea rosea TaxID=2492390 RepID=UPI001183474F|nr:DUF1223 domain-containing protein [Elioraea rosea]